MAAANFNDNRNVSFGFDGSTVQWGWIGGKDVVCGVSRITVINGHFRGSQGTG